MDWGLVLSIAALVLAIPLAIIANIITPKVNDLVGKRSIKNAEKQVLVIEQQLEVIKKYKSDSSSLIAFGIRSILKVLLYISLASALNVVSEFAELGVISIVSFLVYYIVSYIIIKDISIIENVINFEKYTEKIKERLKKVKGNIKKSDKLDIEGIDKSINKIKLDKINKKQFFVFYASVQSGEYKKIWNERNEGIYHKQFLGTELSRNSVNELLKYKKEGNLENIDVLGLYFKDNNSRMSYKIKLLDFICEQGSVKFKFELVEEMNVKSGFIMEELGSEFSYYASNEPQLIVKVERNIKDVINKCNKLQVAIS